MRSSTIPDQMLLSSFLAHTPDHVYFKDEMGHFVWVSASLARSLGSTTEAVVGKTDFDFFDEARAQAYRIAELRIMSTGEAIIDQVVQHTWPDGHHTWALNVAFPMRNADGRIVGIWGTNKDITSQVLMEQALEKANRDLTDANSRLEHLNGDLAAETRRANEMTERAVMESEGKSRFLAVVSHEIRNPLNAVMGCAELLGDSPLDPMQRDYVETILESARATLILIKDLLDFAKIQAGALEMERLEVNLPDALEDVVRLLSLQAHAKGLEVSLDIDPGVPELVQGDPTRLGQVLLNLGSNAVKFTERGEIGFVAQVVDATEHSVSLRFEVRDTGIGIPAHRLAAVFEPYCQADRSTSRRFGGTGLGLPIVTRIVELMGGQTGVQSKEGSGSTFWFTAQFPLVTRVESRAPARPAMKGRVLVVDDHAAQRKVLSRQLQQCGLEVVCAASADEALAMLQQAHERRRPIDVALLDHQMPGCDGVELGHAINSDPSLCSTRLVLLTSCGQRHEAFASIGFAACLTKPVTRRDLFDSMLLVLAGNAEDWHTQTSPIVTRRLLRVHRGREKRCILVAEDLPAGRKVAVRTLEKLGYRAVGVTNGREAVTAWETGNYHLILMDCEMPELDGYDATREIRRRELPGQRIPIVALTGRAMSGAELECKEAGMDAYLAKPLDRERLELCIDRMLGCDSIDASGERPVVIASGPEISALPVDIEALRILADRDEGFMRELVADFIDQGQTALIELGDGLANRDASSLATTAHALKTTAGALRASALQAAVAQLESAARDGAVEQFAGLTAQVRRNLTDAMEFVRTWAA